jgi:hypothetical protein
VALATIPSDESVELTPIRTVDLDYPVTAKESPKHSDVFAAGQPYVIIRLEEFERLVRCGACHNKDKALSRVVLLDEVSGEEIICALDCLKDDFGITRAKLKEITRSIKLLTSSWQTYAVGSSSSYVDESSTSAALSSMAKFFETAASFDCPAIKRATQVVQNLLGNIRAVSSGSHEGDISTLQTLMGLQRDHRYNFGRFVDRGTAFLNHPRVIKAAEKLIIKRFYAEPERAEWKLIQEMDQLCRKVYNRKDLPIKLDEVAPTHFQSKFEYRTALANHMIARCRSLGERNSHLSLDKCKTLVNGWLQNRNSELYRNSYLLISVADKRQQVVDTYDFPRWTRDLLEQKGFHYYFAKQSHYFQRSEIEMMQVSSVQDMLRQQLQEDSEVTSGNQKSMSQGYFRGLVIWKPDAWFEAYAVWNKYGGPTEGRNKLENVRFVKD